MPSPLSSTGPAQCKPCISIDQWCIPFTMEVSDPAFHVLSWTWVFPPGPSRFKAWSDSNAKGCMYIYIRLPALWLNSPPSITLQLSLVWSYCYSWMFFSENNVNNSKFLLKDLSSTPLTPFLITFKQSWYVLYVTEILFSGKRILPPHS